MSEGDLASWIVAGSFVSKVQVLARLQRSGCRTARRSTREATRRRSQRFVTAAATPEKCIAFDRWTVTPVAGAGLRRALCALWLSRRGPRVHEPAAWLHARAVQGDAVLHARRAADGGAGRGGVLAARDHRPRASARADVCAVLGDEMRAERARLVDLQVEHDFDGAYVFGVRRFYQNVDDQLVTMFRVSPAGSAEVGRALLRRQRRRVRCVGLGVPDEHSRRRARMRRRSTTPSPKRELDVHATPRSARRSRPSMRAETENIHDITTSIHTDIPETATRFYLIYRINTAFTRADRRRVRASTDGSMFRSTRRCPSVWRERSGKCSSDCGTYSATPQRTGVDLRRAAGRSPPEAPGRRIPRSLLMTTGRSAFGPPDFLRSAPIHLLEVELRRLEKRVSAPERSPKTIGK